MSKPSLHILMVEDSPLDAELTCAELADGGLDFRVTRVDTHDAFRAALGLGDIDLILSDYVLPTFSGLSALEMARELRPEVPFIFLSGALGEELAIDSLKNGATDYVIKQRLARLVPAVRRAIGEARERAERRRAEDALRRSEQQLRLAVEAARLGTFDLDVTTGRMDCSDRCKANFGLPAAARFDYPDLLAVIHPEDLPAMRDTVARAVEARGTFELEYRAKWPDGAWHWIHVNGSAACEDEGRARIIGVTVDVTTRKTDEQQRTMLLESERAARTEMERAGRLKDEFLATLGHELRTPLNAILGYAQLLRMPGAQPTDVAEGLDAIERNARVQAQIVEDLLDMSRITSGKIRLDVQPIDLAGVVEAALETVKPAASAKNIRLLSVIDPRSGPVAGDPNRLQQVVWNLVSNAIKFTPKGGRVQVVCRRVDSHVELAVSDSGQGIKPEFLPHIFEKFRQADGTITRGHGGLGLGLSIARHLVELHGGQISATSAGDGRGATFIVTLPLSPIDGQPVIGGGSVEMTGQHPRSSAPVRRKFANPPSLAGIKVLVVDDEPDARTLVKRLLEQCGADVITAASARDAVSALELHGPDVLLSDIGMPEQDGYELIRRIRARDDGRETIPAAALTAFARSEDRTRALMAGYQTHVAKPVEPSELCAVVASLAGRNAATAG